LPLNGADMFDPSAPHIIVLLIVVLLLFGSRRLPGAAKSLGESMHIFKKSVHGLDENGKPTTDPANAATQTTLPPAAAIPTTSTPQFGSQPTSFDAATQQQQMAEMQRQLSELQRQNEGVKVNGVPLSEAQSDKQPF
jgi:sec-independent protein translocase protein TatA